MDPAARAETWLRVYAGRLVGPPAPAADEVDRHGFLALSSVAYALAVLEVLDPVTIDAVFADLGLAAGIRGRKVAPNAFRSGDGLVFQLAPGPPAGVPWPPETSAAGACLELGEAVVQLLWLTRTPTATVAPARVRLPAAGGGARLVPAGSQRGLPATGGGRGGGAVPLGPGVPPVEVVDDGGGVHHLSWLAARGDGRRSWGTVVLEPPLAAGVRAIRLRVAGTGAGAGVEGGPGVGGAGGDGGAAGRGGAGGGEAPEVSAAVGTPAPARTGRCEDDGRSPAERYLDRLGAPGPAGVPTAVDLAGGSVWDETCAALRELGLVGCGYARPRPPAEDPADTAPAPPPTAPLAVEVPAVARPIGAVLPLAGAGVFVEGFTVEPDRVEVHVRHRGQPGAASTPWWHAEVGAGARLAVRSEAVTMPGAGPPAATMTVPLPPAGAREIRLVASTPFEAGFVDLELP